MTGTVSLDGDDETVTFREIQRARTWSMWAAYLIVTVLAAVFVAPSVVIPLTGMMLLYLRRITIEVRDDGVYVRNQPLHSSFRRIPFSTIERCEITGLGWLGDKETGLWKSLRTKAYVLNTGKGVKLYRNDARSLLIGTQRPDELMEAIAQQVS